MTTQLQLINIIIIIIPKEDDSLQQTPFLSTCMYSALLVLSYTGRFGREIYWYLEKCSATLVVVTVAVTVVVAAAVVVCVEMFQF